MSFSLANSWNLASMIWRRLGLRGAATYLLHERLQTIFMSLLRQRTPLIEQNTYYLHARDVPYPMLCRTNTSDRWAFGQVFVRQEYGDLPANLHPKLIIDCGANVGYTSVYFLERFPESRLIAVEPDEHNFHILQQNLAPYTGRARAVHAALWSEPANLIICKAQESKGEWASWVRQCQPDETPDIIAVDVQTLLIDSDSNHIDILKIDIEGAEATVFSRNYEGWIDKVETFLIELHNPECEQIFQRALHGGTFAFSQMEEVTMARRVIATGQQR